MRRLRRVLWVLVVIAAIGSVGLAVYRARQGTVPHAQAAQSDSVDLRDPRVGKTLPALNLTDLEGHAVSADQLRGRPVLLNFWATWCIPCRAEMPELQHEANSLGSKVMIVGVDDGEDAATIRSFTTDLGITYPIWRDSTGQVDRLLNAPGLPYSIFLDRGSTVRSIHLGQMDRQFIDARLRDLLR